MKDILILTNSKFVIIFGIILLLIGVLGFYIFEKQDWISAIYDSCAVLSTVGLGDGPMTSEGKVFASFYTLISGLFFVFLLSILLNNLLTK